MTRINCAIPPRHLTDQHLLAEHREIKRVPNAAMTFKGKIPEKFCLGTGHVSFFMDKGRYTAYRYAAIHTECIRRGFQVEDYSSAWDNLPPDLCKDYTSTEEDFSIVFERIDTRTKESNQTPRYCGIPVAKTFYTDEKNKNILRRELD